MVYWSRLRAENFLKVLFLQSKSSYNLVRKLIFHHFINEEAMMQKYDISMQRKGAD